ARRPRAAPARARRGRAPLARGQPRPDGGGTNPRADRPEPRPHERRRPADRPRLSVQPLRAGAVPRPRDPGHHPDDGGPPPPASVRRHARATRLDAARTARPRGSAAAGVAGRRIGARARHVELPLPRLAARPRLGDRARPHRRSPSLPVRDHRPVRALPPAPRRAPAPAAPPPEPAPGLGLGRGRVRALSGGPRPAPPPPPPPPPPRPA